MFDQINCYTKKGNLCFSPTILRHQVINGVFIDLNKLFLPTAKHVEFAAVNVEPKSM